MKINGSSKYSKKIFVKMNEKYFAVVKRFLNEFE